MRYGFLNIFSDLLYLSFQVISGLIYCTLRCSEPTLKRGETMLLLFGKHFIGEIPATDKKFPQKRCRVCYKKGLRKEADFQKKADFQ